MTQHDLTMNEIFAVLELISKKTVASCDSDDQAVTIYSAYKKLKNQRDYRLEQGE